MLIVMKPDATIDEIGEVERVIIEMGFRPHRVAGSQRTAIGITGNQGPVDRSHLELLSGVADVIRVSKPYKIASLDIKPDKTIIRVGDASIGGDEIAIIAGPCAVESRDQAFSVAEAVHNSGARFFRGGAFKPRTSPYSFQGLGEEGLKILSEVRELYGLKIVTEAVNERGIDLLEQYADVIQIGARNMQNFSLLSRAGQSHLPVLLKRGLSATLDEWLSAAEYIMAEGNYQVVLCERGVRTFSQHARNTLDLAAVLAVRDLSHLPVVVDPSHAAGKRNFVSPLALAGVVVGADGLIIEVHNQPEVALSDGSQSLTLEQYQDLIVRVKAVRAAITPQLAMALS
jgi:3-deoxy-7-phosphoheptulonate synthase